LTAVASATSRLRIGTLVLDNDYRHPVMLARRRQRSTISPVGASS
jgi:alkanesulfonate monooxygenase SsuD/methylene tetrahydromethanopterin reductase-like flavin-dependent oxidoreductase (luciferase family)